MKRSIGTNNPTIYFSAMVAMLCVLGFVSISNAKPASYALPPTIDSSANYLFFLHNFYVEQHGPNGACKYYDILKSFEDNGFTVVSDVRSGKIIPSEYAKKIVGQIKSLLAAGVPPKNILMNFLMLLIIHT